MNDAFLARYGHQDIHRLRGIDRPLTQFEKAIFAWCLERHIHDEVRPAPDEKSDETP